MTTTQRIAFSNDALRALPPAPPGKRYRVVALDEPGLVARVNDKGHVVLYLNRRPVGSSQPVMVKLLRWRSGRGGNLAEARRVYAEKMRVLEAGKNPNRETLKKVKHSFGEAAEAYIAHLHRSGLRQVRNVESSLRREFLGQRPHRVRDFGKRAWRVEWRNTSDPAWRNRELHRIDRAAVRDRLQTIAHRSLWAMRHAHGVLSRVYRWLIEQERFGVENSPVEGMRGRQFGISPRMLRRRRILGHDELAAVWRAAGEMGVYGTLVRVLMLTGQRLSDFAKAKRSEMQHDGGMQLLVIAGERYKNDEPHEVPLTPKVRELLGALPTFAGSDWVFTISGNRPFNDLSRFKARLDKMSGVSKWVLHDLRRTLRTGLGTLRVPRDVAERVIGHSLGELDEVYDRGSHRQAKYEALLARETRLLEIVRERATV